VVIVNYHYFNFIKYPWNMFTFFFGIFRCVLYYFFFIIIRLFFVKNIFNTFIFNKIHKHNILFPTIKI